MQVTLVPVDGAVRFKRTVRRQESLELCNAAWAGNAPDGPCSAARGRVAVPFNPQGTACAAATPYRRKARQQARFRHKSPDSCPRVRKYPAHRPRMGFSLRFHCGMAPVGDETGEGLMGMEFKVEGDTPLRVIVADDDPLARRMLRDVLQLAGITVIAEAGSGREAVELTTYYTPDVVVMDLIMPGMDGLAAMGEIRRMAPDVRVVILTSSDDDEVGLMTLRAGASGFLCKNVGIDALPRALHCAKNGEAVITRRLTMRLIEDLRMVRTDSAGLRPIRSALTSREWEVLDLLCQDLSTDDIADRLVVSVETVRSHVKNVLRKLEVRSRREAVAVASRLRAGMLEDGLPAQE
jgi:DNA-binding NarL/FixJ family response regulator